MAEIDHYQYEREHWDELYGREMTDSSEEEEIEMQSEDCEESNVS